MLAAFQYDGDRLELEVWRDGVRAHRYDSWPDRDDESANDPPLGPDPAAFLDFATGPVDSHRLASALADTPIDAEDMDVDGEPGYVWAQALHWDVLRALSHPDQVIRRAQWDYCHMCGAPQARGGAGQHRTRCSGHGRSPVLKPDPRSGRVLTRQHGTWRLPEVSSRALHERAAPVDNAPGARWNSPLR